MNKSDTILKKVIEEISLSNNEEREIALKANKLIKKIKPFLTKEKILIGGSFAKGTLVRKEEQDIDVFTIFNNEELTINLEKILKKAKLEVIKVHGSRDYFQLGDEKLTFEFIPITKLTKNLQNKNVTDFSPLHISYIKNKTTRKLIREIKLAKAFCQAQKVYGAESYIQGLSGYAIELLICHYKTFIKFLKGIQKDDFFDIEKRFKNKKEAFGEINESKLSSPIVLIDPTYKYRNVCAGLGKESLSILKEAAKMFLKNPSVDFFKLKDFNKKEFISKARKKNLDIYQLDFSTDRENRDIAGTKMKKFFKFLLNELSNKQQELISSEFVYSHGKTASAFISLKEKKVIEIRGPKVEMVRSVKEFKKVRKNILISRGFAYAKEEFNIDSFFEARRKTAEDMNIEFSWKKI